MNKNIWILNSLMAVFCGVVFFACEKTEYEEQKQPISLPVKKQKTEIKVSKKESPIPPKAPLVVEELEQGPDFSQRDRQCRNDDDCILIPINSCMGCSDQNGSQAAVNRESGKSYMEKECMNEIQEMRQKMQQRQNGQGQGQSGFGQRGGQGGMQGQEQGMQDMQIKSNDPSCQYNWSSCQNGLCEFINISQKERQEKIQRMQQQGQQRQNGQQGFGSQPQNGDQGFQRPQSGGGYNNKYRSPY